MHLPEPRPKPFDPMQIPAIANYYAMVERLARQYLEYGLENGDSLRDFLHSINDPRDPGLKIAVRKRIKQEFYGRQ